MDEDLHSLAIELDAVRAGFDAAERAALYTAMDKDLAELTDTDWALIDRYTEVRDAA